MHYNSENPNCSQLYVACTDYATFYHTESLSTHDAERLCQRPQLQQKTDWQTSRALLHLCANAPYRSISHSQGNAVVFAANHPHIGTDMEIMRQRDFDVWLQHICHDDEIQWLHQQSNFATACYALWTLKESLLKGCGKELADIRNVGIRCGTHQKNDWHLYGDTHAWKGSVWQLGMDYVVAAVWTRNEYEPNVNRLGKAAQQTWQQLYCFQAA